VGHPVASKRGRRLSTNFDNFDNFHNFFIIGETKKEWEKESSACIEFRLGAV
jgi:hypothetical protein